MDISPEHIDSLTATETWELAVQTAGSPIQSQDPSPKSCMEYHALCHALSLLEFPVFSEDSSHQLLHILRQFFVTHQTSSQIPFVAKDIAIILIQTLQVSKEDIEAKALILSQAAMQISAAILSCMKRYPDLEKKIYAAKILSEEWNHTKQLNITEILTALIPSSSHEISVIRTIKAFQTEALSQILKDDEIHIFSQKDIYAGHDSQLSSFFNALKKRENHDPDWAITWLRSQDDFIQTAQRIQLSISETAEWTDFYLYWLSQAWLENQQPERSLQILQWRMSQSELNPILCLQLARTFLILKDIGQAANSLEMAASLEPATKIWPFGFKTHEKTVSLNTDLWKSTVQQVGFELGRIALQKAMHAQQIDDPLLELAMKHGAPHTFTESVLCWLDADLNPEIPAEYLILNDDGRREWIRCILKKRNSNQLDKLYQIFLSLSKSSKLENDPELILLETASQLDNLYCASNTLERALHKLSDDSMLYWDAVMLWIDIQIAMDACDKALMPWITPLSEKHPDAIKVFKYLLVTMPKSALGIIQNTLVEAIGPTQTKSLFEYLKSNNPLNESTSETQDSSYDQQINKLSSWLLPFSWQILYQSARLNPVPTLESKRHEALKAQVLQARGLIPPKTDPAPEPAKWIHQIQPKASDAFD